MIKKKLIHLSPGPIFELKRNKYKTLCKYYEGDIITSSPDPQIVSQKKVCGFSFNCIRFYRKFPMFSNFAYLLYCLYFCLRKRMHNDGYAFVTTYDPLKTGLFGVLVSKLLRTKLIVEVNGVYTSPAEYLDGNNRLAIRLKKFFYPIIEKFVLSRADGIKQLFPAQLQPFQNIMKGKIVHTFPNLVNINAFLQIKCEEKNEILCVGFPFKRKGIDILIAAFKSIADKCPDWSLRILGWFPDPTELLSHIDNHPQIHYVEPVMPSEMPEQIGRCAIFVLPSRSEAMGRVLVEAMAAGKPRIGANVDGIPTVINDGVDGLLFHPEDSVDLAEKMLVLIRNPEMRGRLGRAGRMRAVREMNEKVYFENLICFYEQVLHHSS